jgi:hypothetical protein
MNFNEIKASIEEIGTVEKFEIKQYLPFTLKAIFVNDMIVSCIAENESNMKIIDFPQKRLCFDVYILRDYAGVEFNQDDICEQYDYLKEKGVVGYIMSRIDSEDLKDLKEMVEDSLAQELKVCNSMEGIVNSGITKLITKIPETGKIEKWVKALVKSMKDFDPKKQGMLQQMMEYANSEGTPVSEEVIQEEIKVQESQPIPEMKPKAIGKKGKEIKIAGF